MLNSSNNCEGGGGLCGHLQLYILYIVEELQGYAFVTTSMYQRVQFKNLVVIFNMLN